jgi:hypothetical protein
MTRFITYPDLVDKESNHTVTIVDATVNEIEDLAFFCKVCEKDYDVYLYKEDIDDLNWLGQITVNSDKILVNDSSKVRVPNNNIELFGKFRQTKSPIDYFQKVDS